MCSYSTYIGLDAVVLWSPSIYYMATWTLRELCFQSLPGLLPLRLPPGCPVAAATVVIRYLYTDVEVQIQFCRLRKEVLGSVRLV